MGKSTKASTISMPSAVSDSPKLKEVKKANEKAVKIPTGTGKGNGSDNQPVVSDTKKQLNVDWKARYEQTKKNLEEKENTIKQLDVKIPNMIQEFQKCITNKDNLIDLRDNKLKEVSATVESKEKTIAELTSGSRASKLKFEEVSKEKENELKNLTSLNVDFKQKHQKLAKDSEASIKVKDKEIENLKSQLTTTNDSIKKMENMRNKLRSDLDKYIAADQTFRSENSKLKEGVKDLMKAIESKESSTKNDLSKLRLELEKMTQDRDNKVLRISFLEADLNLNVQELEK